MEIEFTSPNNEINRVVKISFTSEFKHILSAEQLNFFESLQAKENGDYFFNLSGNYITITDIAGSTTKIINSPKSVNSIISLLGRLPKSHPNNKYEDKIKRISSKFKRKILSQTKSSSEFNQFINFFEGLKEIENFPTLFLTLNSFKKYQSCTLLIHEKGAEFSHIYNSNLHTSTIPTSEFNSIYSLIKKSKNKTFNVENLHDLNEFNKISSSLNGTFLAEVISLKQSNVCLIISRNDFLLPTSEEHVAFKNFSDLLPFYFSLLLKKRTIDNKIKFQFEMLQEYPQAISISLNNEIIFANNAFLTASTISKIKLKPITSQPIILNYFLEFYDYPQGYVDTGDIVHFQKNTLLSILFNTLKHELSNPLFGLKLASEILILEAPKELPSDNDIFMHEISNNIKRCENILNNFSNIYNDIEVIETVSLKKSINETLILAKSEIKQFNNEVIYSEELQEKDITIHSNSTWIIQILFNLIINSSQSFKSFPDNSYRPSITLNISLEKNEENTFVSVVVSDNGPGINKPDFHKLFNPFFTTKSNGTGLGLTICKHLAEKMKGDILFIESTPYKKTSFKLMLPLEINS